MINQKWQCEITKNITATAWRERNSLLHMIQAIFCGADSNIRSVICMYLAYQCKLTHYQLVIYFSFSTNCIIRINMLLVVFYLIVWDSIDVSLRKHTACTVAMFLPTELSILSTTRKLPPLDNESLD